MSVVKQITHNAEWHKARLAGVGSSDAAKVMNGEWHSLWMQKTGRAGPDNLDDILAVQMGSFTEPLNLYWFGKMTGIATAECKERLTHPEHPHMHCELDGNTKDGPVECKHTSQFSKPEEILARYYWQLQHQMAIAGASQIYLSVFYGNSRWEYYPVARDDGVIANMITQEAEFWRHVTEDIEPQHTEPVVAPTISMDDMREVDLTGNNEWAAAAADWLENKSAKAKFDKAAKSLKSLIEPDVKLATGHNITATRSKNGAIRIGEMK